MKHVDFLCVFVLLNTDIPLQFEVEIAIIL